MTEGNSIQQNNLAFVEWAGRISLEQIPSLLVFLTTRLLAETTPKPNAHHDAVGEGAKEELLNASELAQHLHLPESWVRTVSPTKCRTSLSASRIQKEIESQASAIAS